MCRIHLRVGANKQTLALALLLSILLAVWAVGLGKYLTADMPGGLTADMPGEPLTKTRSLGR